MVRTLGIEEELLLVDPDTRAISSRSGQVIEAFRQSSDSSGSSTPPPAADDLDSELFGHQLEVRTDPVTDLAEAKSEVLTARRTAGLAAAEVGLAIMACGAPPRAGEELRVTREDRYLDMVDTFGATARSAGTCAMHVHVGIGSAEEGVAVLDRIAPWLPVLLAVSANSPFHDDRDTGYASWRSQMWRQWPSAGTTEQFGSVAAYDETCRFLVASGAARDRGMLYLDARLSDNAPTVEVRTADVCIDPDDTILVAALVRGLVETAARSWSGGGPVESWRAEHLRACHWRAARFGLAGTLVHPSARELAPAREVLEALATTVGEALTEAGDHEVVADGVERVLAHGGAAVQRAAFERTGSVSGVVDDLVERTRASWEDAAS